MRNRRFSIIALVGFLGAGLSIACSGHKVGAIDDGGAEIPTDPASSDQADPSPSSGPTGTTPNAEDASVGDDIDAASLFDGGLNFPLDAGPDGSASFCRKYDDLTVLRGKDAQGIVVQLEGPGGKPRPPMPQCFRIRKGTTVVFEGDVVNNPVVILGSDGGAGALPPDTGRKDRSTVVFSATGSFYFATQQSPNIERGHIIVEP